jgi:hypothetical protein
MLGQPARTGRFTIGNLAGGTSLGGPLHAGYPVPKRDRNPDGTYARRSYSGRTEDYVEPYIDVGTQLCLLYSGVFIKRTTCEAIKGWS